MTIDQCLSSWPVIIYGNVIMLIWIGVTYFVYKTGYHKGRTSVHNEYRERFEETIRQTNEFMDREGSIIF